MAFYDICRGPLFRPGGLKLTKRAVEYCCFPDGSVIADIGCGMGETSVFIEKNFPITVLNVEPSASMTGGKSGTITAWAENTPFGDNSLDGALCECVLSLSCDITAALDEMRRIIKHNGYLIISDMYSTEGFSEGSGAIRYLYPKERYLSFIKDAGFETILFEERSHELAIAAANLIMAGEDCETTLCCFKDRKNIGYFLLIARKP